MTESPRVLVERDDKIAVVIMNRPEARNALDLPMVEALRTAFRELSSDPDLAAVILKGAGNQAFVAGADIAQLRDRKAPEAFRRINQALFREIEEFDSPTIAAVQGWALGGGCELSMACDLRVAADSAKFGQPEVGLGIIPGAGATHRLQRLVGLGAARELIFTGKIIDAQEAQRIGLVNRVVPHDELLSAARELADQIGKNSTGAVRLAKLAINTGQESGARTQDVIEMLSQAICFESEDKHARMTRFLEKKNKGK